MITTLRARPAKRPSTFSPDDGLAVITGASTGIGAALARLLARRHYDLMLVIEPDEPVPGDLQQARDSQVMIRRADLADAAQLASLCQDLAALRIAVLCDNAGIGRFGDFADIDSARQLAINVTAVTALCQAVVPGMRERGRGGVLLTGSVAGGQPIPRAAVYAASKAYVNSLGRALHTELRRAGIACTVLAPGPVATAFPRRAGVADAASHIPDRLWASADDVAAAGLAALERGQAFVTPDATGRFCNAARLLPAAARLPLLNRIIAHYTSSTG